MATWRDAVTDAILRHAARTGSRIFTRQEFIAEEIGTIVADTGTGGLTPTQTLGRELQEMRDEGLVEFIGAGRYRWRGALPDLEDQTASKAIFVLPAEPAVRPEQLYVLAPQSVSTALRAVGEWIIYQAATSGGAGPYFASARVEKVELKPGPEGKSSARMVPGTYLDFGRVVPFERDGAPVEQGLLDKYGQVDRERADRPVRALSDADFDRIVQLGLVTADDTMPRTDVDEDVLTSQMVAEAQSPFEGPVERATMLVSRKVRDRQFRKRVLDVYGSRCALTGMKLVNGGGRTETEAAHIMSVEAGGPDAVNNGIALSGTIHWMFDRGLVSLSDAGDILLSRGINDRESVERLIFPDRKARFPAAAAHRPHPQYLHWHRTWRFHD